MANTESRVRLVFEGSERGVVAAAAKSAAAIRGLSNENTKVGKTFAVADQGATKFIQTTTKVAAVTSLVAAGGGLIGQAFAGALPILTSLGIAGGTVKLGMDGIKKSAEQLKKPFADLKKNVSEVFVQELTPVLARLVPVIPQLSGNFEEMAVSISGVADKLVDVVASVKGIQLLKDTIKGAQEFIVGFGGGLATFLDGLLSGLAAVKDQMRGLGEAFGSIFGSIGNVFKTLANDNLGTLSKAMSGFSATLTGLGRVIGSVIDVAIRLGAAFGDSFGVLFTGLADGINKASPGLVDLGSALGDLFRAIAPLLPTIGELAGQFAHALADGIRTVIPYVQQFADWAKNNVGTIKVIGEGILALALAVKGLNVFTSVIGWVDGAVAAFRRFRGGADGAATSVGGLNGASGRLKNVLGAAGLLGAALAVGAALDQMNIKAAGGAENLKGFEENLHDLEGAAGELLSGDFGKIGSEFGAQMDETKRNIQSGQSAFGEFLGFIKRQLAEKLPPIDFNLNTGPALAQVDGLIGSINKNAPTVNINGNTNGAAFAYREILREIAEGKSEIIIDGQPIPAQEALKYVEGLINNSIGEITINGRSVPAAEALALILGQTNTSTGTMTIAGNADPATGKINQTVKLADGSTGTVTVDGKPDPATGKINGVIRFADGSTGTVKIDGNQQPANGKINATVTYADGRTGTIQIAANPASANATINGLVNNWNGRRINLIVTATGSGGIASAGRLAAGGPVYGPGTGTSDTAGLFALSKGEHVLTAKEVKAAGGHDAIMAFRRGLTGRPVPRMASHGRVASGGGVSSSGALNIPAPQVNVQVHVDGNEVRSIVRTEISQANRSTRRTVLAGSGASF
jgi:hypothetical protein